MLIKLKIYLIKNPLLIIPIYKHSSVNVIITPYHAKVKSLIEFADKVASLH
jgi:hypothetical protein